MDTLSPKKPGMGSRTGPSQRGGGSGGIVGAQGASLSAQQPLNALSFPQTGRILSPRARTAPVWGQTAPSSTPGATSQEFPVTGGFRLSTPLCSQGELP